MQCNIAQGGPPLYALPSSFFRHPLPSSRSTHVECLSFLFHPEASLIVSITSSVHQRNPFSPLPLAWWLLSLHSDGMYQSIQMLRVEKVKTTAKRVSAQSAILFFPLFSWIWMYLFSLSVAATSTQYITWLNRGRMIEHNDRFPRSLIEAFNLEG